MIALDTNVLVRFLVVDDPEQTERAKKLLGEELAAGRAVFIGEIVICETIWVLTRGYRFARAQIGLTLKRLLAAPGLHFGHREQLERALEAFEAGRADFADYLIREQALAEKCRSVATFDRGLRGEAGFVML